LNREQSYPKYAHSGPPGDLCADLASVAEQVPHPGDIARVRIGIAVEFPPGYGALIENRSGWATMGVCTLRGVIDPGYRGEIQVILANIGPDSVTIHSGDRVAQMRIVRRVEAEFVEVHSLQDSERSDSGFGSTGP
jgi:dUTP pyrophosphatase